MFLPGDAAKTHRTAMTRILQRYYAGDTSLVEEIEANATATHPINQMARDAPMDARETMMVVESINVTVMETNETVQSINTTVMGTNDELQKLNEELFCNRIKIERQQFMIASLNADVRKKDSDLRRKTDELQHALIQVQKQAGVIGHLNSMLAVTRTELLGKSNAEGFAFSAMEAKIDTLCTKVEAALQIFIN
jgi:hypothetical protein